MERTRASARYQTLGFIRDELADEECVECGEQATVCYAEVDGDVHYCDAHDPEGEDA